MPRLTKKDQALLLKAAKIVYKGDIDYEGKDRGHYSCHAINIAVSGQLHEDSGLAALYTDFYDNFNGRSAASFGHPMTAKGKNLRMLALLLFREIMGVNPAGNNGLGPRGQRRMTR